MNWFVSLRTSHTKVATNLRAVGNIGYNQKKELWLYFFSRITNNSEPARLGIEL
jgi:hypothetical protein